MGTPLAEKKTMIDRNLILLILVFAAGLTTLNRVGFEFEGMRPGEKDEKVSDILRDGWKNVTSPENRNRTAVAGEVPVELKDKIKAFVRSAIDFAQAILELCTKFVKFVSWTPKGFWVGSDEGMGQDPCWWRDLLGNEETTTRAMRWIVRVVRFETLLVLLSYPWIAWPAQGPSQVSFIFANYVICSVYSVTVGDDYLYHVFLNDLLYCAWLAILLFLIIQVCSRCMSWVCVVLYVLAASLCLMNEFTNEGPMWDFLLSAAADGSAEFDANVLRIAVYGPIAVTAL